MKNYLRQLCQGIEAIEQPTPYNIAFRNTPMSIGPKLEQYSVGVNVLYYKMQKETRSNSALGITAGRRTGWRKMLRSV